MQRDNGANIMKSFRFYPQFWAYATLILIFGSVSTGVSANTITMIGYNGAGNIVSCEQGCEGFVGLYPTGPILTDPTEAHEFPKAGNPTKELARLNELLALIDPARTPVGNVNKVDGDGNEFETSLQYFSIKKAKDLFYFENTSGGTVKVKLEGATKDYSHWTEYGPLSQVPIPASVWLFGTALIAFVSISRRRKVG